MRIKGNQKLDTKKNKREVNFKFVELEGRRHGE